MYTHDCQAPMAEKKQVGEEQTERFQMRVSQGFLKIVDELRRAEPDLPSRAEMIRRAIERAAKEPKRRR